MKTPKMIKRVGDFLDAGKDKQQKQIKSIKEILRNLKKKQDSLKKKSKTEKDDKKRKRILKELDIIFAQRKKGINALKKLKKG